MSLIGRGIVAIWNDIAAEGRANFYEWHNREHIPERLSIPGFRRGRRYIAAGLSPEYFTLYEADTLAVLSSRDYQDRLNNPTPWTARTIKDYRNLARSLSTVTATFGQAAGGFMAVVTLDALSGDSSNFVSEIVNGLCPTILARVQVVAVHLGITDVPASSVISEEKRGQGVAVPLGIVMVEGTSATALERPMEMIHQVSRAHGASSKSAIYQLEIELRN